MMKNTNPLWSVMNFIPFYNVFMGQKLRKVAKMYGETSKAMEREKKNLEKRFRIGK